MVKLGHVRGVGLEGLQVGVSVLVAAHVNSYVVGLSPASL